LIDQQTLTPTPNSARCVNPPTKSSKFASTALQRRRSCRQHSRRKALRSLACTEGCKMHTDTPDQNNQTRSIPQGGYVTLRHAATLLMDKSGMPIGNNTANPRASPSCSPVVTLQAPAALSHCQPKHPSNGAPLIPRLPVSRLTFHCNDIPVPAQESEIWGKIEFPANRDLKFLGPKMCMNMGL